MRLFTPLAFKVTLILFAHGSDGFMFSAWLRSGSSTEQNLPAPSQYKLQTYANSDGQIAVSALTAVNGYESKKDFGKPNVHAEIAAVAVTPPRAFYGPADKETVAAYNNQRTGISAPPKYDKPWSVLDAVVVHSISAAAAVPSTPIKYVAIPAQNYQPYFYYRDNAKAQLAQNAVSVAPSFTTTLAPQKFVQVELNYKDDTLVKKIGEIATLQQKIPGSADPAESIQTTSESSTPAFAAHANTSANATEAIKSSSTVPIQRQNFSSPASEYAAKWNLQSRPIKLFGSNTLYASPPVNFTFTPQLYYAPALAPITDVQYISYPFPKSPLVAPFLNRNVPRAVSERSEITLQSAPQLQLATIHSTNNKSEKPICNNCLLPSQFPINSYALKISDANDNAFPKPCSQESVSNSPPSSTFKSSNLANFAYVLVPSQIIKNHPSRKR